MVARLEVDVSPRITQLLRANSRVQLSFTTAPGVRYAIEYKNSIQEPTWTLFDFKTGTGDIVTVEDASAILPNRFYRVRVD